jgi:hypothetical protein
VGRLPDRTKVEAMGNCHGHVTDQFADMRGDRLPHTTLRCQQQRSIR